MRAIDIRTKYLKFFEKHNHKIIQGASLIPDNDSSVLFTPAGMHPLVPYLVGEKHPAGNRLVNYQKCIRTIDIESVGDSSHLTCFEMMGNWSLGDYFKEESIKMSFQFLTEELNIPVEKIYITCFAGDKDCPKDLESAKVWEEVGIAKEHIYFFGKKENWWGPVGNHGPCGPDTEIFYDTGKEKCTTDCNPSCSCGKYIEIWNNVFMQYYKNDDGTYEELKQKNVDTGLGLERAAMTFQGKSSVFDIEIFAPIMEMLKKFAKNVGVDALGDPSSKEYLQSFRIIADHLKASMLLISDGVRPSNLDQGYVLRRLIRRVIRHIRKTEIDVEKLGEIITKYVDVLKEMYPELEENEKEILETLITEKNKFMKTLVNGEREFIKAVKKSHDESKKVIEGEIVFRLYETYGFPPEITEELAKEQGLSINIAEFEKLYKEHQEKSRQGAEQKFKGGLAEQNEETTCYHTATHLLHKALKQVLGEHVAQKGSNITVERMRFDFSHPEKMTPEQLKKVEVLVNEQIARDLTVICEEMTVEEAKVSGATGLFETKYGELVKVYTIGNFSKEICGGPHVARTSELGKFEIKKEEAVSAGVRRIKAVLIK